MFTAAELDELNACGDAELDPLVTAMADHLGGVNAAARLFKHALLEERLSVEMLDVLLRENLITQPIVDFFRARQTLPALAWLNREQIHAGGEFFRRRGLVTFIGLAFASLPACYCWNIEAMVLDTTGRLAQRHNIPRRIPETAQFVLDIGTAEAFIPGGIGIQAAHKIRLLHALIRYLLLGDPNAAASKDSNTHSGPIPRWQPQKVGAPISQEFLAATLLTFHYVVLHSMERLCMKLSEAEKRDYLQRWNVAGWLLGIEPRTLEKLQSMDEAVQLYQLVMTRRRATTANGRALSATLLRYMRDNLIEQVLGGILNPLTLVPRVLTRYLSGKETSAALELRLTLLDRLFYIPIVLGTRFIGWLDNFPLFQSITRCMTRYAASHLWRLVHASKRPAAVVVAHDNERPRPTAVFVHPDLAAAWRIVRRPN